MNNNMEIAATILSQLGGNRFKVMTGSKIFAAIENGLSMHLTKNMPGAKYLQVKLNSLDLYDLKFTKIVKDRLVVIKEVNGIYADQLQKIFTNITGLDTHL